MWVLISPSKIWKINDDDKIIHNNNNANLIEKKNWERTHSEKEYVDE